MTDVLNVLILSGHMTREHDNEHRSFRLHNQWITTLLEDTGRFRVRVVEDPRGLGADVIEIGVHRGLEVIDRDRRASPVANDSVAAIARLGPTGRQCDGLVAEVRGDGEAFEIDADGRDAAADRHLVVNAPA